MYNVALKQWNLDTIELYEEAKMILVNRNNSVLGIYELSKGGVASTIIDTKMVLSVALKCNASGIFLLHNHPSGKLNPSESGKKITNKIAEGCNQVDLKLIDHLIITKEDYYSFADNGIL